MRQSAHGSGSPPLPLSLFFVPPSSWCPGLHKKQSVIPPIVIVARVDIVVARVDIIIVHVVVDDISVIVADHSVIVDNCSVIVNDVTHLTHHWDVLNIMMGCYQSIPQVVNLEHECMGVPKTLCFDIIPMNNHICFENGWHRQFNSMYISTLQVVKDRHTFATGPKSGEMANFGDVELGRGEYGGFGGGGGGYHESYPPPGRVSNSAASSSDDDE
jgi:hypothetical protein